MLTLSSGKTKTFKLLLSCGTDCGRPKLRAATTAFKKII
jgi:hypothetical protein